MQRHRVVLDLFACDRCHEPIPRSRHRFDEQDEDVVGFRREVNDVPSLCQPPLGGLQREFAKVEDVPGAHDDFGES